MTISPLPSRGDVIVGRDVAGRTLRISGHPKSGRVVLSIWQDTVCRATLRLAPEDVPEFVEMLTRSAIEPADPATAEVRRLHGHHRADATG
ncbi:hypothetical protein [Nostocoides sp. HKS02]|uniref:hypothetical protein n=1 Tax=Nostocoides sp. HKS02 TaxID=1813880 RepID=UPI0012B4A711|nr:hypothetical protein [Tetrasphaera sp. HKS02]QGN58161.1 hypothetical protein GKE56_09980 [Tetrasphaera sp. HKS02]